MEAINITPAYTVPEYLVGEVQSKLAYVDEWIVRAEVAPTGDRITLDLREKADQKRQRELDEKVQMVVRAMVKGAMRPKVQVLEDYSNRPVRYHADPHDELMSSGELSQEAEGIFTLGPMVTQLIDYFESRFLELAASFGAQAHRFPTLIPAHYMERVKYFSAFPHSLSFVTHLREDLNVIDQFAQSASCNEHGELIAPTNAFAKVGALLSPAVCYHLYFALADRPLKDGQLTVTAVGNCFRYEAINLTSIERMWNFTMREVIFVGPKEFVLENREMARKRMSRVFEEIGLAYRVESANDPFFVGEFRKQSAFQSAFQLKFEIRARLPFKDSTLAIGSYNYHQDFFGRHLDITLPDGSPAHTGCAAFGLERMAYAFLAQYGCDPQAWPETVKQNGSNKESWNE
jgi:seryl-tRNA synthetase